jgi:ketosteroid isomerase-like protein
MKGFFVSLNLILVALFLTTAVFADDVEDIKALELEVRIQESAGNTAGFYNTMVPEFTIFPPTGGLLAEPHTEENRLRSQARFDSGWKYDIQVRNMDVKVYGNTAVSTYYTVSTIHRPGVESVVWNLRMTGVWVKQAGQWMVVHRHESRITLR